jgi:hypothetical protein
MRLRDYLQSMALTATAALIGCGRHEASMSTEDIIREHRNSPIGSSIEAVAQSLAKRAVLVGTEDVAPTQDGKLTGNLRLKTAADNQEHLWAYVYTGRDEFSNAFPRGGPFAEMTFADVFTIIERDSRFGGIYVNSASDPAYLIPREIFDRVKAILKRSEMVNHAPQ